MYQIALCDDDPDQLHLTTQMLDDYGKRHPQYPFRISAFSQAVEFSVKLTQTSFDLILLDICMPGLSGLELASELRAQSSMTQIIFLTASREFAVDAIALNATHYLVKPFTLGQFEEALDRAFGQLEAVAGYTTVFKSNDKTLYSVDVRTILSVESFGHNQLITCTDHQFQIRGTQIQVLSQLNMACRDGRFVSVYKGIIINQAFIHQIGHDYILLKQDKRVPIVKKNAPAIKEAYLNYMFQS